MQIEIGLDWKASVETEIWLTDCEHWAIINGNIWSYREELFGALQAVMQSLALFNIFINDLGEGAVSVLIKPAEDIKVGDVSKNQSLV